MNKAHPHPVKVAFRVDRTGEVTAIFPEEPGDSSPYTCSCYAHLGQHGACDPVGMVRNTRRAYRKHYAPLLRELRAVGYRNLIIVARVNRAAFLEERRRKLGREV